MKLNKAYKFRLYPTKEQIKYIEGNFNACRKIYNDFINFIQFKNESGIKIGLTKKQLSYYIPECKEYNGWLKDYDSCAMLYEIENLANAFKKFFKGGGYPKFKSKKDNQQSFRTRQKISLLENAIRIPKLKTPIECVVHRPVEGTIKQFTISRKNNKYYVSIMTEIEHEQKPVEIKKEVGIDLGVKTFLTRDDGIKVENPKFLEEEAKHLAKLQQKLSRTKPGSNNHKKIKHAIATLHEKIKNKRDNFKHNESSKLVNEFDRIYMEDLNVAGMTKSAKGTVDNPGKNVKQKSGLNKSILDVGFGGFKNMIEYKTKFNNKEVVLVDRFFASSKTCNNCGTKNKDLKLSDRIWICSSCGTELDRDENAAKNIKAEGRKSLMTTKK